MAVKRRFIYFVNRFQNFSSLLLKAYKINCKKTFQSRFIKFKNQNDGISYEDPISLSPFFCATKLKGLENVYSEPFIEYFYSQTKQDFLLGTFPSETNEWKEYALDVESNLSKCDAVVAMINGGM
jgi:hypothetical protein